MSDRKLVIYLEKANSRAFGSTHVILGNSAQRYTFIWSDQRKQFVYGEVSLDSDTAVADHARMVNDFNDMVAGLQGPGTYSAYLPAFAIEGLEQKLGIKCAPPAALLCRDRGLKLEAMVEEGLVGNGPYGEIQVDDIESFLSPTPPPHD